jgi:Tol biopolymer transport system component
MKNRLHAAIALLFFGFAFSAFAQDTTPKPAPAAPRAITIDDFFQIRDVLQPELSADGQWIAYTVRTCMLKEDKSEQRLWAISIHGGDPLPLTAEGVSSSHARWSPDGKYLSFLSARNGGKSQVWLLDRRGGEAVGSPKPRKASTTLNGLPTAAVSCSSSAIPNPRILKPQKKRTSPPRPRQRNRRRLLPS